MSDLVTTILIRADDSTAEDVCVVHHRHLPTTLMLLAAMLWCRWWRRGRMDTYMHVHMHPLSLYICDSVNILRLVRNCSSTITVSCAAAHDNPGEQE
eukprot:scaffold531962_cov40-Prasinocladus_malaysianus.AAC.2